MKPSLKPTIPRSCFTCKHLVTRLTTPPGWYDPPEPYWDCIATVKGTLRQFPFFRTRCRVWEASWCRSCNGSGAWVDEACDECDGTGGEGARALD